MSDMIDPNTGGAPAQTGGDPAGNPPAPPADGGNLQGDRQGDPSRADWIPPYRFSEVTRNLGTVQEENQRLREQVERLTSNYDRMHTGLNQALGNAPGQPVDPQVTRIREQFMTVFPELRAIVDNAQAVSTMIEQFPTVQGHMTATNEQLAASAFSQIDEQLAPIFAGEDGKVPPFAKRMAQQGFIDYLQSDKAAFQRYVRGDKSLVTEWFGRFENDFVNVVRRQALAAAQNRGQRVMGLPRTGPATSVTPAARPPKPPASLDEAIEGAWNAMQGQ